MKKDDPNASLVAEGEASHEMRAFPVAAQLAPENLPTTDIPDPGQGDDGGETHDIAQASILQTKGPSDGNGAKNWNALPNVVVPQNSEENQGSFTVDPTPITGQGPPSFAQSEFYTVSLIFVFPPLLLLSLLKCPCTCRLSVVNAVNAAVIISR